MIKQKIHLNPLVRLLLLRSHKLFMEQARSRVLDNFSNIKIKEATEQARKELYEKLSRDGSENADMRRIAEQAENHDTDFYSTLHEVRGEIAFAILAALYHRWEKNLRWCIESNFGVVYDPTSSKKQFRQGDIEYLIDKLQQSGWDVRSEPWFWKIDACRLIVNVYKHGEGNSHKELVEKYPEFLKGDFDGDYELFFWQDDLLIKPEGFYAIADAFRQFWENFPGESLL